MSRKPLSETHAALAAEAVGWDPRDYSYGSQVLLDWRCPLGHVYQATPNNRSHGTTCSFCSSRQVLPGFNDLATRNPRLAAEVAEGDPTAVTEWSHLSLRWRCARGHEWVERVSERSGGYGCPYCSGQRTLHGFNDLATTHPDVAAEADGWDPTRLSMGSNIPALWRCPLGHRYEATPNKRTSGRGCPYCSGNRVLPGFNDFATAHPELAAQAVGWDPRSVTAGSNQRQQWRCERGHEWEASVKDRSHGRGCPVCRIERWSDKAEKRAPGASRGRTAVVAQDLSLAVMHPDLAAEACGWDPASVHVRSGSLRLWRCTTCHQEWEATVVRRVDDDPCPYCTGKRVLPGVNDLQTHYPELADQALGWDPSQVLATTWKRLAWVCGHGHDWVAPVGERRRGYGCPYCAGRKVWVGFNDLATTDPEVALEADGWDPTSVTRGHEKPKAWLCGACGFRWTATPNNRTNMRSGCPACADHGYNATKPGYLYLLGQPHSGLVKVGITNVPEVRFAQHQRRQWRARELLGPMDGEEARRLEQGILAMVRSRGIEPGDPESTGQVGGYTETWREAELGAPSLSVLLTLSGLETLSEVD